MSEFVLEQSRVVDAPAEDILAILEDQTLLPELTRWSGLIPPVRAVEVTGGGRVVEGDNRRVIFRGGFFYDEVITRIERGPGSARLAYRVTSRFPFPLWLFASAGRGEYRVEPGPRGPVLRWTAWVHLRAAVIRPLAWLFRELMVHGAMRAYLDGVARVALAGDAVGEEDQG